MVDTKVKCLRLMSTAIIGLFLSTQTMAQKNDSIDQCQFVVV